MNHIDILESQSIYIIREAFYHAKPLGLLWSMGKDSNVLLWLVKKAFFGHVPFKVILLDTGNELDEVYAFRDHYVKEWDLNYINQICPPIEDVDPNLPPKSRAAARKTLGLEQVIAKESFKSILLGIRRDEQSIRSKERVFSPRTSDGKWINHNQPMEFWDSYKTTVSPDQHLRVHPLLAWTELDIWHYIKREGIPVVSLYFAKNGKRYRSLGEKDITAPIESQAANIDEIIAELQVIKQSERAGRMMDSEEEDAFEKLRLSGYM